MLRILTILHVLQHNTNTMLIMLHKMSWCCQ